MLDVESRIDVDALVQQFQDVEVALGVAAAGRIGVGEFVDQRYLRSAGDQAVEVHLLEPLALVLEAFVRNDFEVSNKRLGLLAAVRLDDADDHGAAFAHLGARGL